METPTYAKLRRRMAENNGPHIYYASGPTGASGNPRHYKHFWQVFSLESPLEGGEFLQHAPGLCIAQCEAEIARLHAAGQSCMLYGWRRPRKDPANPWDLGSDRWKGVEFAPAWDEDSDPVVEGGHR